MTDPPYFSAIGYANLSDYFYPWIRLALRDVYPDLFATISYPKGWGADRRACASREQGGGQGLFHRGFTETFTSLSPPAVPIFRCLSSMRTRNRSQKMRSSV